MAKNIHLQMSRFLAFLEWDLFCFWIPTPCEFLLHSFEKRERYKHCQRGIKRPKFFCTKCQKQLTTCFSKAISSNMENDYAIFFAKMDFFAIQNEWKKFEILSSNVWHFEKALNLLGIIISVQLKTQNLSHWNIQFDRNIPHEACFLSSCWWQSLGKFHHPCQCHLLTRQDYSSLPLQISR